jgi:hypothetical protein
MSVPEQAGGEAAAHSAERAGLTKSVAVFVGWLSGSLGGIGAILYACGYLATMAQLNMLGLSGLVSYGHEHYLEEGGRFILSIVGQTGEILFNLLLAVGIIALPLGLAAGLWYLLRRQSMRAVREKLRGSLAKLRGRWPWRAGVFVVLLVLLFAGAEDPQAFNDPLEVSNLLFAGNPERPGLPRLLADGDSVSLKAIFSNSLLLTLQAGVLMFLAWQVVAPWRWRLLAVSPFFIIFMLYVLLLPMLYGVLQRQIRLPLVTLVPSGEWPVTTSDRLFLLNRTDRDFVLWDAGQRKVLLLPLDAVKAAEIREVQPIFARLEATGGSP